MNLNTVHKRHHFADSATWLFLSLYVHYHFHIILEVFEIIVHLFLYDNGAYVSHNPMSFVHG